MRQHLLLLINYLPSPYGSLSTNLLFCALVCFDRVVDVLHGSLYEADGVWPLGLRIDALLRHYRCDVSEHLFELVMSLLV